MVLPNRDRRGRRTRKLAFAPHGAYNTGGRHGGLCGGTTRAKVKGATRLPDRVSEVPVSSLSAYVSLGAAGLLPSGPGSAPTEAISRDYAAALLYRLYIQTR